MAQSQMAATVEHLLATSAEAEREREREGGGCGNVPSMRDLVEYAHRACTAGSGKGIRYRVPVPYDSYSITVC